MQQDEEVTPELAPRALIIVARRTMRYQLLLAEMCMTMASHWAERAKVHKDEAEKLADEVIALAKEVPAVEVDL